MGGAAAPPPAPPAQRGAAAKRAAGGEEQPRCGGIPPVGSSRRTPREMNWGPPGQPGAFPCPSPPPGPGMSRGGQTEQVSPRGAGARRNVFEERGVRRDRHKFYSEAFSLMAPIAWRGGTPASNSQPPASDSAARSCRRTLFIQGHARAPLALPLPVGCGFPPSLLSRGLGELPAALVP